MGPRRATCRRSPSRLAAGRARHRLRHRVLRGHTATRPTEPCTQIEAACERAGWELAEVVTDRESGRGLERPGLAYALEQIAEGKARGLVVSDLRRLSRSIVDLGALMEWFRDAGAGLVALDLGVDTSTPAGHEVAATLITLGDWERERIARRTRSGLAEVKASGRPTGRPTVSDRPDLVERITAMRGANMTLQAIADQLNAEGVPTLRGRSDVAAVERAGGARAIAARAPRTRATSSPLWKTGCRRTRQSVTQRGRSCKSGKRIFAGILPLDFAGSQPAAWARALHTTSLWGAM